MADSPTMALLHHADDSLASRPSDLEFDTVASDSVGTSGEKQELNDKSSMELSTELEGGEDGDELSDLGGDSDDHSLTELEADEGLLAMIASGQVELEEDDEYEDEDGDEASRSGSTEDAEIPSSEAIELAIPEEDMQPAPSPKKRMADTEIPSDCEGYLPKKPKIDETTKSDAALSSPPTSSSPPTLIVKSSITTIQSISTVTPITECPTSPVATKILTSPTPKPASAPRAPRSAVSTPSTMLTRTRASHASAGGMVPEHSLSVPKYFNRDLVRVIEIPVWSIRETYEVEEDMRTKHQTDSRNSSNHARTIAALADLERRFMAHARPISLQNGSKMDVTTAEESDDEEVGDDSYYAKLHYRKEISERLRWVDIPGADRFKPEDRNMTPAEFKASTLWPTYVSNAHGRLLPEEKWAQNLPDRSRHRRPTHRSHSTQVKVKTKPLAKGTTSVLIPKGFVLKIKSANGTSFIGRSSDPSGNRSTLPRSRSPEPLKVDYAGSYTTPSKKSGKRGRTPKVTSASPLVPSSPYIPPPQHTIHAHGRPFLRFTSASNPSSQPQAHTFPVETSSAPIVAPLAPSPPKITKFVVKFGSRTFAPSTGETPAHPVTTAEQILTSAPPPQAQI